MAAAASTLASGSTQSPSASNNVNLMSAMTKLGSAEYREREAASKVLLDDPNLTLSDIESQLKNPSVKHSAEVKTRLLSIAKDRFLKSDRAALGFMFGGNLVDRVVVGQTYPKFPVHGVLHVGDIIIEADGVDLCSPRGRSTMQAMIVSRDPGQALPMTIRRGKEKLKLDIKLGKFSDLEQFGRMPAGVCRLVRPLVPGRACTGRRLM